MYIIIGNSYTCSLHFIDHTYSVYRAGMYSVAHVSFIQRVFLETYIAPNGSLSRVPHLPVLIPQRHFWTRHLKRWVISEASILIDSIHIYTFMCTLSKYPLCALLKFMYDALQ